jgi:RsiW-degrading membrane proteinase PrsW (M82 family)
MSDQNPNRMQTPTPRDHNIASMSELMPFRSSRIKIWKSPLFMLAILAALATPLLFSLMGGALDGADVRTRMSSMIAIGIIGVFFLLMVIQLAVYLYVKPGRSLWIYMLTFALVAVLLASPLSQPYFILFRQILPGQIDPSQPYPFIPKFIKMLFAAGLMEELLKATPILIGAWLTHLATKSPSLINNVGYKLLRVRGPVDGALMGVFAGGGFIFLETAFDYIPRLSNQVLQQTNDPMAAVAMGMMLLLPRVFGGLVGHMAYSGLFGYFIGLSVIRPKQMWQLLAIGYLSSSVIHALWNSVDAISPLLNYVVAGVCAVGVVGALLKARQLEAGFAGAAPLDTSGSIVVDRAAHPVATPPAAYPAPAQPAYTPPPAYAPQASAAPAPSATQVQALALDIEGFLIPLRAGSRIDPGAEPALGGRGAGVVGEVVAHPSRAGVLGLRNVGGGLWTARLRDGGVQTIEPNQNIRLAPGVVISFGQDLIGAVRSLT